jgi:NitT/TauT family transport system substrate-binding protein
MLIKGAGIKGRADSTSSERSQRAAGVAPRRAVFGWLGILVTIVFVIDASSMTSLGAGMTRVRAAYVPVVNWLPAWIAKDKKIFEKNGLDVSLTPTQNISVLPGTLGRQFDFAPSTPPDLIKAVIGGVDVVAVAGQAIETRDNPSTYVIVRGDSMLRSIRDLKGKVIGTPTIGAIIHASLLHSLKKNGIDPASIRAIEVPFPNMADQLKAGNVDAVEALEPFVGQLLASGNRPLEDPLLSEGDELLYVFWISQSKWAESHREVIEAWVTSLEQAKEFIGANPNEARAVLAKYTGLPAAVAEKIPFPTYRFSFGSQDFSIWMTILKDLGQISQRIDEQRLVVNFK